MTRLVDDALVEQALRTLATTAQQTAAARAIRLRAEFARKRTMAKLILEATGSTSDARRAWAESHPLYETACDEECEAVELDEQLRAERSDAAILIDAWRTESASNRAGGSFK